MHNLGPLKMTSLRGGLYLGDDDISSMRQDLVKNGYVKIPRFLRAEDQDALKADIELLEGRMVRRDFVMPGYDTPRHLHVAGGRLIKALCPFILDLYSRPEISDLLGHITGSRVYQISHPDEFVVVNFLTQQRDTHGWHLDDPKYALVIAVEVPEVGGHIEVIPNWLSLSANLSDRSLTVDQVVHMARNADLIIEDYLERGDAYLLNASESLHRVTPVHIGKRVAINFAYHDKPHINYGQTATLLYSQPDEIYT